MTAAARKTEAPKSTAHQLGSIIKACRDIMRKDKGLNGDIDRLPMLTWIMFLKFLDDMEQVRQAEAKLAGKRYHSTIEAPYRWRDWAAKPEGVTGPELIAFINQDEAVRPDGKRGAGLFAYLRSLESLNGDRRDVVARVFEGTINRMVNGYLLRDVINRINDIHFTSKDEIHTLGHMYESMLREMRDAAGDSGEFYTPRSLVKFIITVVDPRLGEKILDPAAGTGGFLVEAFEHLRAQSKRAQDYDRLQHGTLNGIEAKPLPYLLCEMNLLLHGMEYPEIDPGNALRFPLREIGDKDRVDVIVTNPPFGGEEDRMMLCDVNAAAIMQLGLNAFNANLRDAALLCFKAAESQNIDAEGMIGVMTFRGIAMKQDLQAGFALLNKTATAGSEVGQYALAEIYDKGVDGIPKNPELAALWRCARRAGAGSR